MTVTGLLTANGAVVLQLSYHMGAVAIDVVFHGQWSCLAYELVCLAAHFLHLTCYGTQSDACKSFKSTFMQKLQKNLFNIRPTQ